MDQFEKIKAELDRQLKDVSPNVGIAFSEDLFREFRKRGWLTLENFGALGTDVFSENLPAYDKTHFAFSSWGIEGLEFKVGQEADTE